MQPLFNQSRPRFWIYIFGPFFIGSLVAVNTPNQFYSWSFLVSAFYFIMPANLFIYGINDIYDYETDKINPKKVKYEKAIKPADHKRLWLAILLTNFPFWIFFLFNNLLYQGALAGFLFFSFFYSAHPIRAKARPFLDGIFNALYIFPAIMGFTLLGGKNIYLPVILAGPLWCMAMHAYSALPDISADKKAAIQTTATFLGLRKTTLYCAFLYIASAILSFPSLKFLSFAFLTPYLILLLLTYRENSEAKTLNFYRYFPLINTAVGALMALGIIYTKFI